MFKKILLLAFGLLLGTSAMAQEWGLTVGIHQTAADIDKGSGVTGDIDGKLGFDLGALLAFELVPDLRFRTGLLYEQRGFDFKDASGDKSHFNFAYIDVPVNVQYNFTPMVAVFGGGLVGIKASDSVSAPSGADYNIDMKTLYPLLNVGMNFTFDDMIGFDVYAERGVGEFATDKYHDSYKDYTTFGLRFIYWL
jgi:hypothetical protein